MKLVKYFIPLMWLMACQTNKGWLVEDERPLPWMGKIYAPEQAGWISYEKMLADLQTADVVLLGERHDHPDHWRLQKDIAQALHDPPQTAAWVFEHFQRDQQGLLDELRREQLAVEDWPERLDWQKSGWPAWKERFEPLISYAVRQQITIIAANLNREEVKQLYQQDLQAVFDQQVIDRYRLETEPLRPEHAKDLEQQIEASHCHPMQEPMRKAMVRIQRGRDLAMAEGVLEALMAEKKVILFAGSGHVRNDWGLPEMFRRVGGKWRVRSVAMLQAPDDWQALKEQGLAYDYVWLTPAVDLRDPCEVFRQQLKKFKPATKDSSD